MSSEPALARRTVRRDGMDLAVWEGGEDTGPVVLFVHGWPDTHHLWLGVAAALADDVRVVLYDTRGHGASADPGSVDGFRLEVLAEDLRAVADAVSPDTPVHLVGHDWGSVQAWEAVCEPWAAGRIASFTSISGPNIDHLAHWMRSSRNAPDVLLQALSSWYIWYFISPLAPRVFARGSRRQWERLLRRVEGLEPQPWHHADTLIGDMVSGLRIYRANVLRRLRDPRERRTTVPVLQLIPTRDVAIRPASYAETRRWAGHVEQVRLPHGHWVPLSHPDVVAAQVRRFVTERERAPRRGPSAPPHAAGNPPRPAPAPPTAPADR